MQNDIKALQRDILELKTAQTKPAWTAMNAKTLTIAAGRYSGDYYWRITFKDVGDTNPPIVDLSAGLMYLRPYDQGTNTQLVELSTGANDVRFESADSFEIFSTRPIQKIEQITSPLPLEEWIQVRAFYPADMGTTPGWCLQNSRLGFHIYSGTYMTARADMEAQQANGTLHSGTPPDYIAVPVYYANYNITPAGHVAVWDHGTVWSDGVQFPSIDSVTNSYVGWGELCDGARVVQHV